VPNDFTTTPYRHNVGIQPGQYQDAADKNDKRITKMQILFVNQIISLIKLNVAVTDEKTSCYLVLHLTKKKNFQNYLKHEPPFYGHQH